MYNWFMVFFDVICSSGKKTDYKDDEVTQKGILES